LYKCEGKGKDKVYPRTGHEGPEGEKRYSIILSLTSALDGGVVGGGQGYGQAALPLRMTRYPLYRRISGTQGRSGRAQNISRPHWDSIPGTSSP